MRGMALGRSRRVGRYKLHAAFKGQPPAGEGRDGSGNSARNRLRRFPVACAVGVAPLPRMPRRRVRKCGPGSASPARARSCNGTPILLLTAEVAAVPLASCHRLTSTPTQAISTVVTAQPPLIHLRAQHPLVSVHTGITPPYVEESAASRSMRRAPCNSSTQERHV